MILELPPEIETRFPATDLRLDLALGMYASHRITLGQAAQIAGVDQLEFQRELARRRIPLHYDLEELRHDLETVRQLGAA